MTWQARHSTRQCAKRYEHRVQARVAVMDPLCAERSAFAEAQLPSGFLACSWNDVRQAERLFSEVLSELLLTHCNVLNMLSSLLYLLINVHVSKNISVGDISYEWSDMF